MKTFLKIFLPVLLIIFLSCRSTAINTSLQTRRVTLQSGLLKDSFDIHITLPSAYRNSSKSFPVVFYMDANLKSGNKLRAIV